MTKSPGKKSPSLSALIAKAILLTIFFDGTMGSAPSPENGSVRIKVDQVGYLPRASKLAMVNATTATTFEVKRASNDTTAFQGWFGPPAFDADTGDAVQAAEFSKLAESGTYYLEVPGVGRSWTFSIGPDVYSHTYYLAMRAFYGQRCGIAVDLGPEFQGYVHARCHLRGEFHPSSGRQGEAKQIGGWHDAGDYGRYVVNSAITMGTLLWAFELFGPRLRGIQLNIPESGNGVPDILNEARWNLEWMLLMQDEDGGVWHKQTS